MFGETVDYLYFSDLSIAVSFYTGILGFSMEQEVRHVLPPDVSAAIRVRRDLAIIWLNASLPELAFPKPLTFLVADVFGLYAELIAKGLEMKSPPIREDIDADGTLIDEFTIEDPEGNPLSFYQYCTVVHE